MLDTKTRWSSLYVKLEQFYKIRNAVRKALIDLKLQPSIVFTVAEFEHIDSIVQALEVVKVTVQVLCRRGFKSAYRRRCIAAYVTQIESIEYFSW